MPTKIKWNEFLNVLLFGSKIKRQKLKEDDEQELQKTRKLEKENGGTFLMPPTNIAKLLCFSKTK